MIELLDRSLINIKTSIFVYFFYFFDKRTYREIERVRFIALIIKISQRSISFILLKLLKRYRFFLTFISELAIINAKEKYFVFFFIS